MKLATVVLSGRETVVVSTADEAGLLPLDALYAAAGHGEAPRSMRALLKAGPDEINRVRSAFAFAGDVQVVSVDQVSWLPPVPDTGKIIGVAMNNTRLNNTAHVEPAGPMFFLKPASSLVGHGGNIEIAGDYGFTFPELELGLVIGARAKNISEDEALDYVAGYTIVNDITSQGLKAGDSIAVDVTPQKKAQPGYDQYFSWRRENGPEDMAVYFTYHARSKGTDTFGPMGPWLVTSDEVADPDALVVRGYADGELFAEDTTAAYSYPVRKIISWASRYFTLEPGDVISCGTAAKGTEKFPNAHHDIDMSRITPEVAIEIDGLGRLANPIVHVERG